MRPRTLSRSDADIVLRQIVAYEPDLRLPSPVRDDSKFIFLCKINYFSATLSPIVLIQSCTSHTHLCCLHLPFDFNLVQTHIPSIVVAKGNVSLIDTTDNSFSTSLTAADGPRGNPYHSNSDICGPELAHNHLPMINQTVTSSTTRQTASPWGATLKPKG